MVDAVAVEPNEAMSTGLGSARPQSRTSGITRGLMCRSFDIFIAIVAILFTAPLLLSLTAAVMFLDPGPVLFGHQRLGLGGRPFKCLKFRSMVVDAENRLTAYLAQNPAARAEWSRNHKLRDDPRVTRIGEFLRKSSLDELPQLFNVLRGDMSIVGPRPIVSAEVERYGPRFASYCLVRPGITGLWQISGRNDTTYRERVAMDAVYARNKSIFWDIRILILTIPAVLMARGSY